jgi:hypothetical protein
MCELTDKQPAEQNAHAAQTARFNETREKAVRLFPLETWRELEERIFIACSREPRSNGQRKTLKKELIQTRILTAQGSVVYLLPEIVDPTKQGEKHPDAVVDGFLTEFKTITGKVDRIGEYFEDSRKKADHIFYKIDCSLSKEAVMKHLEGIILKRGYCGGQVIAYFAETSRLYYWDVDDLK